MSCCLSTYTHTGYNTGFDNPQGPDRAVTGPCTGRSPYRHDTGVPQVPKCPPVKPHHGPGSGLHEHGAHRHRGTISGVTWRLVVRHHVHG